MKQDVKLSIKEQFKLKPISRAKPPKYKKVSSRKGANLNMVRNVSRESVIVKVFLESLNSQFGRFVFIVRQYPLHQRQFHRYKLSSLYPP
jgi:hypothetical protein